MKKYLLFSLLVTMALNAQVKNTRNYCIRKDIYHYSYKDMKEVYTRDQALYSNDHKRVLQVITQKPTKDGGFYNKFIETFKYDDKDRVIETETKENIQGVITNISKVLYTHNKLGVNDTITTLNWDQDQNKYTNQHREIYIHNPEGRLLEMRQEWGIDYKEGWQYLFSNNYVYQNNRLYSVTSKYGEKQGFFEFKRTTYYYDEKGREIRDITEKNDQSSGWYNLSKYELTYGDDGNMASKVSYLFNERLDDWVPNFRYEPVKYDKDHLNSNTSSSIPNTTGVFAASKNVLLSYNAYQYDSTYKRWEQLTHNEIFYDFNVSKDGTTSTKKEGNNSGVNGKKNSGSVKLFPNPVSDKFFIESTDTSDRKINVYDLSGKLVKSFDGSDEYNINSLKSGTYVITFDTQNTHEKFKIIKK